MNEETLTAMCGDVVWDKNEAQALEFADELIPKQFCGNELCDNFLRKFIWTGISLAWMIFRSVAQFVIWTVMGKVILWKKIALDKVWQYVSGFPVVSRSCSDMINKLEVICAAFYRVNRGTDKMPIDGGHKTERLEVDSQLFCGNELSDPGPRCDDADDAGRQFVDVSSPKYSLSDIELMYYKVIHELDIPYLNKDILVQETVNKLEGKFGKESTADALHPKDLEEDGCITLSPLLDEEKSSFQGLCAKALGEKIENGTSTTQGHCERVTYEAPFTPLGESKADNSLEHNTSESAESVHTDSSQGHPLKLSINFETHSETAVRSESVETTRLKRVRIRPSIDNDSMVSVENQGEDVHNLTMVSCDVAVMKEIENKLTKCDGNHLIASSFESHASGHGENLVATPAADFLNTSLRSHIAAVAREDRPSENFAYLPGENNTCVLNEDCSTAIVNDNAMATNECGNSFPNEDNINVHKEAEFTDPNKNDTSVPDEHSISAPNENDISVRDEDEMYNANENDTSFQNENKMSDPNGKDIFAPNTSDVSPLGNNLASSREQLGFPYCDNPCKTQSVPREAGMVDSLDNHPFIPETTTAQSALPLCFEETGEPAIALSDTETCKSQYFDDQNDNEKETPTDVLMDCTSFTQRKNLPLKIILLSKKPALSAQEKSMASNIKKKDESLEDGLNWLYRLSPNRPLPLCWNGFKLQHIYMLGVGQNRTQSVFHGIHEGIFNELTRRIASFHSAPRDLAKSPSTLAASGFVYLGETAHDEVICVYCLRRYKHWRETDNVNQIHRQLNPSCPGLANTMAITASHEHEAQAVSWDNDAALEPVRDVDSVDFGPFRRRGASNSRSSSALSSALGVSSTTAAMTATPISINTPATAAGSSASGPQPRRSSINGDLNSFAVDTVNTPVDSQGRHDSTGRGRRGDGAANTNGLRMSLQELGIFSERPRRQDLAILASRLESFAGWPEDSPVTALDAAKAGFFFVGYADSTRCFFCQGGLRNWEQGDNPFVEHARHFPKCAYIRQVMGQTFIDAVQARKRSGENPIRYQEVMKELGLHGELMNAIQDGPLRDDLAVRSLIDEGFPEEEVISAAQSMRDEGLTLSAEELFQYMNRNQDGGTVESNNDVTDSGGPLDELIEENRGLRNNLTCKICMDREVKVVFLPCGHLVACQECSTAMRECPVCRGHIRAIVMASLR